MCGDFSNYTLAFTSDILPFYYHIFHNMDFMLQKNLFVLSIHIFSKKTSELLYCADVMDKVI